MKWGNRQFKEAGEDGHGKKWPFELRLRAKLTLGVVLPLVLILGAFTFIENQRHQEVVISNLSLLAAHSGRVVENNLRQQMLTSNFAELQQLLDSLGEEDEFRVIYLLDTSGQVIFSPRGEGAGTRLDNRQQDCQPCHRLSPEERPGSVVVTNTDGERVFRSMHPIENSPACAQCHDPQQEIIGLLLTDISMAPLETPLNNHLRESLLWWAGTILVTVLVVNVAASQLVLKRLERLAKAMAGVGRGQPTSPRLENGRDEIGELGEAFNDMAAQVEAHNAEVLALSDNLQRQSSQRGELLKRLITAQEDERKRVARELHDELGQSLTGMALQIEMLQRNLPDDNPKAREQLEQNRYLIKETTDKMYDLIVALRPSALDDLGLATAVKTQAERMFAGQGVNVHLDHSGLSERLPPDIETTMYRIIQEALTNILRHAEASNIYITLACQDGSFDGEITDDGKGFDLDSLQRGMNETSGWGLSGMQERVTLCNGQMWISSKAGDGTRISIKIPIGNRS
jgi:signal transduction histidine kinase